MPIGTVDYQSTAPWNDPYNPWPLYSRVSLSAIDSNLGAGVMQTFNLNQFDPVGNVYGSLYVEYSNDSNIILRFINDAWFVEYDGDPYYRLDGPQPRAIPAGYVQGNTAWVVDNGDDAASLSIMADTTYLNPWEFRRRWALNG